MKRSTQPSRSPSTIGDPRPSRWALGMVARRRITTWAALLTLFLCLAFFLFPIYWIISVAFKTRPDIFAGPERYFIFEPTLANMEAILFGRRSFLPNVANSAIVAVASTAFSVLLGTMAGFSLSRWRFRRRADVAFYILSTRMMPPIAVIIPMYLIFRHLGLVDTYGAIIVAHTVFNLPLVTWLMKSFFDDLPVELEEAAKVDGCTVPQAFWRITLPLSLPGLASASIFAFIFSWNEFLFSLILTGFDTRTLPVAVIGFQASLGVRWGEMGAGATVAIIPVLAFALLVQRYLVRGLTAGAVKG